jgi:hypothetical protein
VDCFSHSILHKHLETCSCARYGRHQAQQGSLTCRLKKFAMLLTLCVNTCSLKPTILPRLGAALLRPDDLSPNLNSSSISRCFSASCCCVHTLRVLVVKGVLTQELSGKSSPHRYFTTACNISEDTQRVYYGEDLHTLLCVAATTMS